MNYSVEHLGLPARNPSTLKDWYQRVFAAECVFDNGQNPPTFFLRLPGGVMLEIYPGQSSCRETSDNGVSGWRHVALLVDSIEQQKKLLESRGVVFNDPIKPAAGGGQILFFRDAEDNLLHLVERPKESVFARK